jgi:hypothetical protein
MPDLTSEEVERLTHEVALGIPVEQSKVKPSGAANDFRRRIKVQIDAARKEGQQIDTDGGEFPG